LIYVTRALDLVSGLLGLLNGGADSTRMIEGAVKFALGAAVIAVLIVVHARSAAERR
jgi:hypothetical protein